MNAPRVLTLDQGTSRTPIGTSLGPAAPSLRIRARSIQVGMSSANLGLTFSSNANFKDADLSRQDHKHR